MSRDNLGDRMKSYYEDRTKTYLPRRSDVIIRIDGCHFHTFTKGFRKPFDSLLTEAMQNTAFKLAKNIQGCKLAYVQSDEISLWLTDYDTLETDAWFDNSVQKICSVTASMATMYFNASFRELIQDELLKELETGVDASEGACKSHIVSRDTGAIFDARCFVLPHNEVCNYFIWRQQDAVRNSINSVGQHYFTNKELNGKNTDEVKDMLTRKGINWYSFTPSEKSGTCIKRSIVEESRSWSIDLDTPIFTEQRNYIEDLMPGD